MQLLDGSKTTLGSTSTAVGGVKRMCQSFAPVTYADRTSALCTEQVNLIV